MFVVLYCSIYRIISFVVRTKAKNSSFFFFCTIIKFDYETSRSI